MTARTADARSTRCPRPARRSGAVTALLAVAALAGATLGSATGAVVGAAPAVAAWRAEAAAATQPLTMATWGARIDPRAGGAPTPGANPYSASGLLALGPGHADVVNTSTVPARLVVTLSAAGVTGLAVQTCTAEWTAAGVCTGTPQDVPAGGSATSRTWTVDLEPQARQFVRVSVVLGVAATVTVAATATPLRTTGLDRTAS